MKVKQMEKCLAEQTLVVIDTGYKAGGQASYLDIDKADARQRETGSTYGPRIATIQGVRQPRKVYSGARWDFRGHTAHDGVLVEYGDGTQATVGPRDVIDTLDEYRRIFIDSSAAKAKRENDKQSHNDRVEAAIAKINARLVSCMVDEDRKAPQVAANFAARPWARPSEARFSDLKHGEVGLAALELIADLLSD